ncbi:hypothetical protein DERP_006591 [Dermatophagoides pteronyssinus]|uniref:Uncharacterized protein n=1 Tax=Dermatophagoides pteronyssinus TaxID=6956 RepID=A0ABQ8IQN7_DERPT|nr:hypothetical protein DERP_006591 [Dermatophagoides pteronyssinus]
MNSAKPVEIKVGDWLLVNYAVWDRTEFHHRDGKRRYRNLSFFCRLVEMFPSLMEDASNQAAAYRNLRCLIFSIFSRSKIDDLNKVQTAISEFAQASISKKIYVLNL